MSSSGEKTFTAKSRDRDEYQETHTMLISDNGSSFNLKAVTEAEK